MRVLLIEDDSATAQSIELMLKSESFNVYTTDLGEEGIDLGKIYDYDIILLDLNLPDMSGFEVLRKLRISRVKTPILILSGLAAIEDKIKGLGFGADDYMTKPFHKDELIARVHAIVRRSKGHAHSVIQTGDLVVNLDTKTVEVNGARVHMTAKEYQMLELLALRKGTTLTKESFLNHLYGGMNEPDMKIIDVFICKLRKKLANASGGKDYIETVWGRRGQIWQHERIGTYGKFRLGRTLAEEMAACRFDDRHAVVDERRHDGVRIEIQICRLELVAAKRHHMVFRFLPFLMQGDADLLGTDRIDAVVKFKHVVLPVLRLCRKLCAIVRLAEIERGSFRDDHGRIHLGNRIIVDDVVARRDGVGDAGHLVEFAHVIR
jgi:two-component system cell cycle response regulator CtrA